MTDSSMNSKPADRSTRIITCSMGLDTPDDDVEPSCAVSDHVPEISVAPVPNRG